MNTTQPRGSSRKIAINDVGLEMTSLGAANNNFQCCGDDEALHASRAICCKHLECHHNILMNDSEQNGS
jgi:hypothetical protein